MKVSKIFTVAAFALMASLSSCVTDDGNYSYLSPEDAGEIKFDTVGMPTEMRYVFSSLSLGQHIEYTPKVKYAHPENLDYKWLAFKTDYSTYKPVQVGNAQVYPEPKVIGTSLNLSWDVDLEPGTYKIYIEAVDRVTGMKAYFYPHSSNYTTMNGPASVSGLFMLVERDGQTDIEAMGSSLMLVAGGDHSEPAFYSTSTGNSIPGKPLYIRCSSAGKNSKESYIVATTEGVFRINHTGLTMMDKWDDLFYNTPATFAPQYSTLDTNTGCEMFINNGKLHVLYASKANDRKYSDVIAGDYEAYPYLMPASRSTWRPNPEAINADQVIYDKKNHCFRPYYPMASTVSHFKSTIADAYADANHLPSDPVAILNGGGNTTWAILDKDGSRWLYQFCFYDVVDNGDLSYGGERAIQNLDGCTDIKNAKYWASNTGGNAFFYATDNKVYSYSTSSGATTSNSIYECEAGEVVTAIYLGGSAGGGWPTSKCVFWIATWNETTKNGRLIQYEMDINNGVPQDMFGPAFAGKGGAYITDGWGKIKSMTFSMAE